MKNLFMELLMKHYFKVLVLVPLLLAFAACGKENSQTGLDAQVSEAPPSRLTSHQTAGEINMTQILKSLDELAELERAGTWVAGMALTESGIRENAGDVAGAVAAAYKELALAYGRGQIQKDEIEKGLLNLLEMKNEQAVIAVTNAILAFFRGQWAEASDGLSPLFDEYDEPDSFGRWMLLVCALEKNSDDRRASSAYKAIRARYSQFPEYWYRGARAFSGPIAADFAENCINSAAQGPFADECRKILAAYTGLKIEDGLSIRTMKEIETIISQSINSGNPEHLDSLLPLIGLPDNPYTVYAVGALRALTSVPIFREYFNGKLSVSSGRLAERLSYICRG
jgi:hypothetical protein